MNEDQKVQRLELMSKIAKLEEQLEVVKAEAKAESEMSYMQGYKDGQYGFDNPDVDPLDLI